MDIEAKITLVVEKSKSGLWFITSPELHGLLISGRNLSTALDSVALAGRQLWEAMEDMRKTGQQSASGAAQQANYAAFFGDQP